jgi:hypothetical protein
MSQEIFKNATANDVVNAKISGNGIIQVDISGVLDGADVLTSILDNEGVPIIVRDCSWMSSKGDVLDTSDGATKYIQQRKLRFSIVNAGASTDINFSVTHETGNIEIIIT